MNLLDPCPAPGRGPGRAVEDALLLLDTGRPRMARAVLADLPGLIAAAVEGARRDGEVEGPRLRGAELEEARAARAREAAEFGRARAEAAALASAVERQRAELRDLVSRTERRRAELARLRRAAAAARPSPPARPPNALAEALEEGRITVERAAELLRVRLRDVTAIAAGRVGLASSAWGRLLQELQA